jgi:hypothetical protein
VETKSSFQIIGEYTHVVIGINVKSQVTLKDGFGKDFISLIPR